MSDNLRTREGLAVSWTNAQRRADAHGGAVQLNGASLAGKLLELAEGDADVAITMLPSDAGEYGTARQYLERVRKEDTT